MKYGIIPGTLSILFFLSALYAPTAYSQKNSAQSEAYYHYMMGNIAEMTGDMKKAINEYKISASLDTESMYLKKTLAGLYFLTGDANSASKEIKTIYGTQPGDEQTAELMAETLIYQKKPDEAIAIYETILATEPANERALFNAGVLYSQLGKYEKGVSYLEKYASLEPSSATSPGN